MKKKTTRRLTVKDKEVAGKKSRKVKGGALVDNNLQPGGNPFYKYQPGAEQLYKYQPGGYDLKKAP